MDLYAENVLDHYRHPRNKTTLDDASVTREEKNWSCGDALALSLKIEGQTITEIGWAGEGCAVSQAAMSILSESLPGRTLADIDALTKEDILELLAIPVGARRMKCALLCLHTLKNALHAFRGEEEQDWSETVGK